MQNPFPGMNPYLEHPGLWHQVHNRLIVGMADAIAPQVAPQYFVTIEQRIYQSFDDPQSLVGIADVGIKREDWNRDPAPRSEGNITTLARPQRVQVKMPWAVKERYLEVREVTTKALITVIELLSPANKRTGEGRSLYEAKRIKILSSKTHLIEIDLLRSGQPMAIQGARSSQYRILVSRAPDRPDADLFAFDLQEEIPDFPVPLQGEGPEPLVSLQTLLNDTYQRGRLDLLIDYTREPLPALEEGDRLWLKEILDSYHDN
ncbi:MAG: DUF4058 family protein [Synechococcales cyanobacterium RU_4_20]|nr:DUF4058 family protein [Synechococcales cyanobacterium RU_4_20]NJR68360.1 DUF4058 family protein [Synechococcales cyanobacterium CRU_2_2]